MKLLHFKPEKAYVGDCFPLYANGTYYIYYLQLDEQGHFVYSLAMSKDLINVTYYDKVLTPGDKDSYDLDLLTGCVIYHKGLFYAIYSSYGKDNRHHMMLAISKDGINFEKTNKILFEPNEYYEHLDTWRDPAVYYDENEKMFHMLFCGKTPLKDNDMYSGCVGHAISKDLYNWELLKPFVNLGISTVMECPDLKKIDDKYVLIYYWHNSRVRVSNSLYGPYKKNKIASPAHFDFMAAKALDDGKRTILFGWIPRKHCDCSPRIWGGTLAIPKQLYFNKNNVLVCKFIDELKYNFSNSLAVNDINVVKGNVIANNNQIIANGKASASYFIWNHNLSNYYFNCDISLDNTNSTIIFVVKCGYDVEGNEYQGYQIILEPSEKRLLIREQYRWDQRPNLANISLDIKRNKPINFQLVVNEEFLEVCLDNEQTLSFKMSKYINNNKLSCSIQDCKAYLTNIELKEKNN